MGVKERAELAAIDQEYGLRYLKDGDLQSAVPTLLSALDSMLGLASRLPQEEGLERLREPVAIEVTDGLCSVLRLQPEPELDEWSGCTLAHLLMLQEKPSELVVLHPILVQLSGQARRFWNEYARALAATITGTPYRATVPAKLKGYQRYWRDYLLLMEGITQCQELGGYLEALQANFRERNARKLLDEHFDGSAPEPALWDVRATGLLWFAEYGPIEDRAVQ